MHSQKCHASFADTSHQHLVCAQCLSVCQCQCLQSHSAEHIEGHPLADVLISTDCASHEVVMSCCPHLSSIPTLTHRKAPSQIQHLRCRQNCVCCDCLLTCAGRGASGQECDVVRAHRRHVKHMADVYVESVAHWQRRSCSRAEGCSLTGHAYAQVVHSTLATTLASWCCATALPRWSSWLRGICAWPPLTTRKRAPGSCLCMI